MTRRLISSGSTFEREIGYSRAVSDGDWVFVSGTTGFDYRDMSISEDVAQQAEQCLKNIDAALREAGSSFADVVRVTYVVPNGADFQRCWPVLRKYFGERAKVLGAKRVDVFLTNRMAKRLNYSSQRAMFGRLLRRAGIRSTPGQRRPSIHSFRHTFAVRRLTQWHRDRKNVQELLPHLSVYLGHIGPASTYWYLTATPELLQTAARSFERQQSQGVGSK